MRLPVRIVLLETSHPGNIGASARAMKTMGFDQLVLVAPKDYPSAEATARASGADDVLARATVVSTLGEAIADCGFIVGASARGRSLPWPTVDARAGARNVCAHAATTPVAIVLGPEHSGLTNDDLGRCHQLVNIPANPEYSSLNLAMAVQVLCYEIRMAHLHPGCGDAAARAAVRPTGSRTFDADMPDPSSLPDRDAPLASAEELEGFHEHLERVLAAVGFLHPDHPRALKLRLRRLFHRSRLDRNEINILRGMLAALDPTKPDGSGKRR